MGRSRSRTGRKLVRVRAATSKETIWEEVVAGRTAETLAVLQTAIQEAEGLLGHGGEDQVTCNRRARTEIRLDSGWGSEAMITWLLARGYQVTGKFKSASRVRKLVQHVGPWQDAPQENQTASFAAPLYLRRWLCLLP